MQFELCVSFICSLVAGSGRAIALRFLEVHVHCGLDFVFVYDGESRNSPLLARVSAAGGFGHPPANIIAFSGQVSLLVAFRLLY